MQYPYIPNSNEAVRKEMLDFIGAKSVEEIYSFIPDEVRMKKPLDIPAGYAPGIGCHHRAGAEQAHELHPRCGFHLRREHQLPRRGLL